MILAAVFCLSRRHRFKQRVKSTNQNSMVELSSRSSLQLLEGQNNTAINEADAPIPPLRQSHSSIMSQIRRIFDPPAAHGSLTPSPFHLGKNRSPIAQPDRPVAASPFSTSRHARAGVNLSSPIPIPPQHANPGATHWGRRKERVVAADHVPPRDTRDRGDSTNPFQDPDTTEGHRAQETGDALYRLQQLTREVGVELQTLASRAQSGRLTEVERERLEEIRHTTGLTIMYDSRLGRFISTSSATSAPPPTYHSDYNPSLP